LETYSSEESAYLHIAVEQLQQEFRRRIDTAKRERQAYQLPQIELNYRNPQPYHERIRLNNSHASYVMLLENWSDQIEFREEFNLLLVNNALQVIGIYNVSKGSNRATLVDVQMVMAAALKANATGMVLAHNHPSGNVLPSEQDIKLTKEIEKAAEMLNIRVYDHLIVTPTNYYSFLDEGMLSGDENQEDEEA